ncbi:rhomboid family intramembrane serine protease [Nanoarchaeota archaeon]
MTKKNSHKKGKSETGSEIRSSTKFLLHLIRDILLTPVTVFHILLRKKSVMHLLKPIHNTFTFIFEAKFTISMILINIILFFASKSFSTSLFDSLIFYPSNLLEMNFLPFLTSGFLHADYTHLFGNMLAIFIFGRIVEKNLGFLKTALVYFGALIIASFFHSIIHLFILHDNIGGLGASGALMGLVSAAILLNPFYITYELLFPLPVMFIGWITIMADITGILNPVEDGIGHFAHLGGFISIAIILFLLSKEDRSKLKKGFIVNLASLLLWFGLSWYF